MLKETKKAGRLKFRSVQPQAISPAAREEWIRMGCLESEGSLPLLVEPRMGSIDLVDWIGSNPEFVSANLLKHGGILFRGFDLDDEVEFGRFAKAISPQLLDYEDQHTPRTRVQDGIYTSTEYPADHHVPFHSENSKNNTWPMKICFFCLEPSEQGGETPIADNRKVFQSIDPKIRRRFIEKRVMYVRNFGEGAGLPWQTVFQTSDKAAVADYCRHNKMEFTWKGEDRLRVSHVCQAVATHPITGEMVWFNQAHLFHIAGLDRAVRESLLSLFEQEDLPSNAYYGDGSPIEDSVIDEVSESYKRSAVCFPWQPKDLLILENMLVAHGRRPYSGTRRILVAMIEPSSSVQATMT